MKEKNLRQFFKHLIFRVNFAKVDSSNQFHIENACDNIEKLIVYILHAYYTSSTCFALFIGYEKTLIIKY